MSDRSRSPRAGLLGVVAALAVALVIPGCDDAAPKSSEQHENSTANASVPSSPETAPVGRREAPDPGTCWRVAPSDFREDHWFDDSPSVPCGQRHNTETVFVYDLEKPTPEDALEIGSLCFTQARSYVGSDLTMWVPWFPALLLPSKQQVNRGESWARCDIAMYSSTSSRIAAASRTGSLKDAITKHPAEVWACTNKDLVSGQNTFARFVDCRKPHLLEATGNLMLFDGLTTYPDTDDFAAEEGPCLRSLSDHQRKAGIAVKTVWGPPSELRQSGDGVLTGRCWRFRKDGAPLPPMN